MSDTFLTVIILLAVLVMSAIALVDKINKIDKYEDTIDEYMMCIEYSPDCECSDIILSEYGEEVE